jgi:hypothetical protein
LGWRNAFLSGRAEPAPPRGASAARMALQGKLGDGAKGDFLGGAHSVRPQIRAVHRPRHLIPNPSVNDGPAA